MYRLSGLTELLRGYSTTIITLLIPIRALGGRKADVSSTWRLGVLVAVYEARSTCLSVVSFSGIREAA